MKIAVTATGKTLDASVDPRFGRCPYFLVIETDGLSIEAVENPNLALGGGAGIQSAQLMAERGVSHVLTGNCGPNAHQTLSAAGIEVVIGCSGTVAEVVERFKAGNFSSSTEPNVGSKFGMGGAAGTGPGFGAGMGGGAGMGMGLGRGGGGGQGMGRGMGRGMGMGGGMRQGSGMGYGGQPMGPQAVPEDGPSVSPDELAVLKQQADALGQQMQQIQRRIEELEKEKQDG